jgi:hypothetical protein
VCSCSEKKIRAGFDMSDRTIPLLVVLHIKSVWLTPGIDEPLCVTVFLRAPLI